MNEFRIVFNNEVCITRSQKHKSQWQTQIVKTLIKSLLTNMWSGCRKPQACIV